MAPKLILHVGDPKTGSSSIQRVLFDKRFQAEGATLDYPDVVNSLALAHALRAGADKDEAEERFAPYAFWLENSRADVAVISAEQFSVLPPRRLEEACRNFLPAHAGTMTVLAYAKPHAGRFLSAYAQRTKVGQLNRPLDRFYREMSQSRALHMHERFSRWKSVFGDRLRLRPMLRTELFQGDVVADFLNVALGGTPFTISGSTEANVSLPVEALAGLRLVHSVLRRHEVASGVRQALGDMVNTLVTNAPELKGTKLALDRELALRLQATFIDEARAMDRDFFSGHIMETALDAVVQSAVPHPISVEAPAYFRPRGLMRLRRLSMQLAEGFKRDPHLWAKAHKRDKGRFTLLREDAALGPDAPKVVGETQALIAEVAQILTRACTT